MLHAIWRAPPQFTGSPLLLARNLHLLDPENLAVRSGLSLTPTCAPSGASPGGFPRGGFPLSSLLSSLPLSSLPCGLPLDSLPCGLPLDSLPCGLSSRRFTFTRCFLFLRWCHANETSTDAVGYS